MTAVEWLITWMTHHQYYIGNDLLNAFEQAEQMEKEQIVDANYDGQYLHAKSVTNSMLKDNAESYYNEKYNNND